MRSHLFVVPALGLFLATLVASRGASAAAALGGDAPNGYHFVNATKFGEVVSTQKGGRASLKEALQEILRDLTQYFGVRPTVQSAYYDGEDTSSGNARFVVTANGRALRGFILWRTGPVTTDVVVVFVDLNAPPDEWNRLRRLRRRLPLHFIVISANVHAFPREQFVLAITEDGKFEKVL